MIQELTKDKVNDIINQFHDLRLNRQITYPEKVVDLNEELEGKGLVISQNSLQVIYSDTALVPKAHRVFNLDRTLLEEKEIFKTILEDSTKLLTQNLFFVLHRKINREEYDNLDKIDYKLSSLDINVKDIIGVDNQKVYSKKVDSCFFERMMVENSYYIYNDIDSKLENFEDLYKFVNSEINISNFEFKNILKNEIINGELKKNYPFLSTKDTLKLSDSVIDLQDKEQEEFIVTSFKNGEICDITSLFKGGTHKVSIDCLVVMKHLYEQNADGFICFHNHPSGSIEPSKADVLLTQKLDEFAIRYGITFIDHFIIAQGKLTTDIGKMNNIKEYEHKVGKNKMVNELFPSEDFRRAILETVFNQSKEDSNLNIYADQLDSINSQKKLLISSYGIKDLRGIEHFKELEMLDVSLNPINELKGLSDNITKLYAHNTNLRDFKKEDIPKKIEILDVSFSDLTSLNVSDFKDLEYLFCSFNNISNLNLSNCDNLSHLFLENNRLIELDVKNLLRLEQLECSNNNLKVLDLPDTLKWLSCNKNQISELTLNHCKDLEHLECTSNKLSRLDIDCLTGLKVMRCGDNERSSHELIHNLANKDKSKENLGFDR